MTRSLRAKPIVDRADDLLTNGLLRTGRKAIRSWDVCFHECGSDIFRESADGTVIAPTGRGHVDLAQGVRAYSNRRYRLDIHVESFGKAKGGKFSGAVQVRFASFRAGEEIRTYEPPVMRVGADAPVIHRAVVQCPAGTGRLEVRLRVAANQPIVVRRVQLVETGDYLLASHALALPPEPSLEPPPSEPASTVLCDGRKDGRPMLGWLRGVFGEKNTRRMTLPDLLREHARLAEKGATRSRLVRPGAGRGTRRSHADVPAVVIDLPEDKAPALSELMALSERTVVIASLATFAGAARGAGFADIRIQDRVTGVDMPCGKIVLAGHFTRGFALADDIPYAWNDGQDDFAHRYLVLSKETKRRLAEMEIRPAILTECGHGGINKNPLTLFRPGRHGALVVMDPDGLEAASAGEEVPRVFELLWKAALGRKTTTLGQYAATPTHFEGILADLGEVAKHYDLIEDVSVLDRVRGRGNHPPVWQLPGTRHDRLTDRPAVLIRTGFAESDWPAVYGLLLWLKRMAMQVASNGPLAQLVLQQVRVLAWPVSEPQQWRGCPKEVAPPSIKSLPADLAGVIDLRVGQERETVVLVPDRVTERLVRRALGSRDAEVRVSPEEFARDPVGAERRLVCRVLLPGIPQAFPANSPILTDLAARHVEDLAIRAAVATARRQGRDGAAVAQA